MRIIISTSLFPLTLRINININKQESRAGMRSLPEVLLVRMLRRVMICSVTCFQKPGSFYYNTGSVYYLLSICNVYMPKSLCSSTVPGRIMIRK
jgi:hypothetical protein